MGRLLVILGSSSGAGKSFLATAVCAFFKAHGYRVAPFKAQNMSLNAVAAVDGEMAWAQFVQALACGIEPSVRFNPVLLKPVGNAKSELIFLGHSRGFVESYRFDDYRKKIKPLVYDVLKELLNEFDVVVAEGAGSPVEINIKEHDFANIALCTHFDAPAILVADIDRGGVFAQIVGTYELLDEDERGYLKGIVINKFRGYEEILKPGLDYIEERLGIPVLAVLPYLEDVLPPEDSLDIRGKDGKPVLGIVRYPKMSNFSDFVPFFVESVGVKWCTCEEDLSTVDALVLPGSRKVLSDLRWMKERGIFQQIRELAGVIPVIGICGGYHMMGRFLEDPVGKEGGGCEEGLGFFPFKVAYSEVKRVKPVKAIVIGETPWLKGELTGYLIHAGEVHFEGSCEHLFKIDGVQEGCVGMGGRLIGTHLHNLFWNDVVRSRFIDLIGGKPSGKIYKEELGKIFEKLNHLVANYPKLRQFLIKLVEEGVKNVR